MIPWDLQALEPLHPAGARFALPVVARRLTGGFRGGTTCVTCVTCAVPTGAAGAANGPVCALKNAEASTNSDGAGAGTTCGRA